MIPKAYIPSDARRLEAYRRLATAPDLDSLAQVRKDLVDAYGEPPKAAERLLDLAEVRVLAHSLGVKTITIREKDVVFFAADPGPVTSRLRANAGTRAAEDATVRVLPPKIGDLSEVYFRPPEEYMEPSSLVPILKRRLMPARLVEAAPSPTAALPGPGGSAAIVKNKPMSFAEAARRDAASKKKR
jgi:hypothetical protein